MKAAVLIVAMSATASASPLFEGDAWLEAGLSRARLEMPEGHQIAGYALTFSPRMPLRDGFYIGAELDRGNVDGQITTPAAFRQIGGETGPTSAVQGSFSAVRLVAGLRGRIGAVSAGTELALGFHQVELEDALGSELGTIESTAAQVEGRARIDLWLTPRFSTGVVAGVDLDHDMTAGLVLGFHAGPYDRAEPPEL